MFSSIPIDWLLRFGVQIPELLTQRKFVSAMCHAHFYAHKPPNCFWILVFGSFSMQAKHLSVVASAGNMGFRATCVLNTSTKRSITFRWNWMLEGMAMGRRTRSSRFLNSKALIRMWKSLTPCLIGRTMMLIICRVSFWS